MYLAIPSLFIHVDTVFNSWSSVTLSLPSLPCFCAQLQTGNGILGISVGKESCLASLGMSEAITAWGLYDAQSLASEVPPASFVEAFFSEAVKINIAQKTKYQVHYEHYTPPGVALGSRVQQLDLNE